MLIVVGFPLRFMMENDITVFYENACIFQQSFL